MIRCPDDERLVRLLEEQLDRFELADVEQHLERCGRCQEALEGLTRGRFRLPDRRDGDGPGPATDVDRVDSLWRADGQTPTLRSSGDGPEDPGEASPRVEGYEILGRLGQGGMGVVYRARQHGLDRLVALKMIRAGSHAGPEHLARFRIEARAVARLRHPNVVQIHDVGRADGLPYVALELLSGGSLEARVAGTPRPERESAELLITLAGAIAAAHRAGVVHRDLKSANVLFSEDGTPKIADFGLAKRLDEDDGQTESGQVMGSPSFMAPEQALGRGREVGPAADLYSLGAILYEMLAGRPPFKGMTAMETLYQVVHADPVPPSHLRPGLSRDLETICLKCLAKDPARRYADADAMADDLRRHLAGSPIRARRTGPRERAWKWARRQPAAAALAVLVIAAVAVTAAVAIRRHQHQGAHALRVDARSVAAAEELAGARDALQQERWEDGRRILNALLAANKGDKDLLRLDAEARALRDRIEDGDARGRRRHEAAGRLAEFARWRREAQVRDADLNAIGQFDGIRATREAARKALDALGAAGPGTPAGPPTGPEAEAEQGRPEVLLILADAVARPVAGEDPRRQAEEAIRILDRADSGRAPTRAGRLLRGSCRERLGDLPGADRERRQAAAIPTSDALGHVLQGRELHRRRDYPGAIAEFEDALRIEPGQFRAQLLMAVCQFQMRRPAEARANLSACIGREPGAIGLYLLRGMAYAEDGYARQRRAADGPPRAGPPAADAEQLFEAAEADYRKAEALGPDDDRRYVLLVNRGTMRFRRDRLDEAEADLRDAVRLRPDRFAAHVPLGQLCRRRGRPDEAIGHLTRAIRLQPDLAALYRSRALARLDRGRPGPEALEESLGDLTEAIRLEGADSPADAAADRTRRARLFQLAGRPAEALADCDDALRVDPDDPDATLIRVRALLDLKRFDQVAAACDAALARGRPSAELFEIRGLARADRKDYPGAIQDYTQARALEPARSAPLVLRGWAYVVSEAPGLALGDFDEALRIAPDDVDAYNGRGFARALQGQHRAAVADAEEVVRRRGSDPRTLYNAARIYARAASAAAAEGPRRNLGQLRLAEDYQAKAQALIRRSLEHLPADRRAAFWRDVVQTDPSMAAIRQHPRFSQLAGQYGRLAK